MDSGQVGNLKTRVGLGQELNKMDLGWVGN